MDRRHLLGLLALAAFAVAPGYGDENKHHAHFAACAKACADCQNSCASCQAHCANLVADGKKEHLATMQLCADCTDVCAAAAKIVSRGGPMAALICEPCAKACDVCGAACEKHPNDEHMKACARSCRECAKACREMLKHVGH